MMASVDGRLLTSRWTAPHDGSTLGEVCKAYGSVAQQLGTSAWMFGKNTLQEGFFPRTFSHKGLPKAQDHSVHHGQRPTSRMFIVADPAGDIQYTSSTVRGDGIITLLSHGVSVAYLEHLREMGVSYLFAGPDGLDLRLALETLHDEFGIESISLQGGGIINGAFLAAGLIDELSVLIYPGIDGLAGVPSIVEHLGEPDELPARGQSLELTGVSTLPHGVVALRYTVHHTSEPASNTVTAKR